MTLTVKEVGEQLVAYCRANETEKGLAELYSADAVSVEAFGQDGAPRETKGLDGIRGKHEWWDSNFDVHSANVDGPYESGDDRFAVIFEMDATHKQSGQRSQMKEVALYHVADGKIVREEFMYTMG